jgi:hypothetical protein
MFRRVLLAAISVFVLSIAPARAAVNVIGLEGELEHNSEYLFGFSGLNLAQLRLDLSGGGTIFVSTNGDQGWWNENTGHDTTNTNYIVGDLSTNGTDEFNNFFTFNLGSLAGQTVVSATLQAIREFGLSDLGNTSHTYTLFDVTTSAAALNSTSNANASIFNDLETGVSYGAFNVTVAGSPAEQLSFGLNGSGVSDINAAIGGSQIFSIGGTLTPGVAGVVPEAATVLIWATLTGIGLAAGWRRSRKA